MQRAAAKSAAVAVAPQASAIQVGAACMPHAHSENALAIARRPDVNYSLFRPTLRQNTCYERASSHGLEYLLGYSASQLRHIQTHTCVSGPRGRVLAEYITEDSLHYAYLQNCRARLRKCRAHLRKCRASGRCLGGSPAFALALDYDSAACETISLFVDESRRVQSGALGV